MVMLLICYALLRLVHRLATHSLIEIYLMTIKLRSIYTGKQSLATNTYSASITHPSDSNNNYGVQFQTSKSKYGDAPLPLTLRMKAQMIFY